VILATLSYVEIFLKFGKFRKSDCENMREIMRQTSDEVLESHKIDINFGLSAADVNASRRIHGLNKFGEEEEVRFFKRS
jgi:magnesium-transporting ATPase (P-type)